MPALQPILTNQFFRYLYALGTIGSAQLRRFWIFNPDKDGEVEKRIKKIIGLGMGNKFKFHKNTFAQAIQIIRTEFNIS